MMAVLEGSRHASFFAVCVMLLALAMAAEEGAVRLVNGPNAYEGRVEYYTGGVWLSLCRQRVDSEVPMVICRQLGYPAQRAKMYYSGAYGVAPGEIFQSRIYCSGNEDTLSDCSFTEQDTNCDPLYTLGVSCDTNISVSQRIRLSSGGNAYEGRLEVFENGVWATVCETRNDRYIHPRFNALVACRELFGPSYGGVHVPAYEMPSRFGILQSAAISRYFVECKGIESSLLDCSYSTPDWTCDHENDFAVECFPVPNGCGGYLNGTSGTFKSPSYPAGVIFDHITDCLWTITVKSGYQIRLSVTINGIDETGKDSNHFTVTESAYVRSSSGTPKSEYISRGNVFYAWLHTVNGSTGIKFFASWETTTCVTNFTSRYDYVQSPAYPSAYPPNSDCVYFIKQKPEFTISFQFHAFNLDGNNNGTCQDYVTLYDGDSEAAPLLAGPLCGSTMPPPFTSSQNVVMIKFHSDGTGTGDPNKKFQLYYGGIEPDPIVTQLTADSGTIMSPGFPTMYKNETDYIWNITTSRPYLVPVLTFHNFSIPSCLSRLQISARRYSTTIASPCGNGLPNPVMSTDHTMYIQLLSTPSESISSGSIFSASWNTECRPTFIAAKGTVRSPEYPSAYPSGLNCTFVFTYEPGFYFQLNFTSFELDEPVKKDCKDYIEVFDGLSENSELIGGKYCGTSFPPTLSSTQNVMMIRFHTDDDSSGRSGFEATYQVTEKECEAQTLTAPFGSVSSPGFPLQFPRNTYCVWTITVDPLLVIELTFNDFSVGVRSSQQCSNAYVRLYDSDTVDPDTVIATFCGSGDLPKVISKGNVLTVVLYSFYPYYIEPSTGFQASYTTVDPWDAGTNPTDMYPYGYLLGDSGVQLTGSEMEEVKIQSGFPFGTSVENQLYIGLNGVVSVGSPYAWPNLPQDEKVVCAYCAYIDNSDSIGGVFYQVYGERVTDADILTKASRDVEYYSGERNFRASLVVVVTWDRVKQGRYSTVSFHPANENGDATFQLVLISDGLSTYALTLYLSGGMTWTYRGSWSYVLMGYSDGRGDNYRLNLYSKTESAYKMDAVPGNSGRRGRWIYKVGQMPINPEATCLRWYTKNRYSEEHVTRMQGFAQLPRCPCSGRDVWRKVRFLWTWSRTDTRAKIKCYRLNAANSQRFYPFGKECCYSYDEGNPATYEQLIMDGQYAGSALAYNPAIFALRALYEKGDRMAHEACCLHAKTPKYCQLYYEIRPVGQCRTDIPFRFAWLWGDPHITTLDEREYIFNGWGEYTLVTLRTTDVTFTLQGRMGRADLENGSQRNATVFTAFGAEENGTRVHVGLHPVTKSDLEIYLNDRDYSGEFQEQGENFLIDTTGVTMFNDNNSLVVTFPSGVSFAVALGIRSIVMSISVPQEFRSMTRGLLGNYNGVKDDDFVLPDGTVLSDNMADRDIHFRFGQKWAVTAESSVLRYGPRESAANYSHPDFVPVFLDELSASERQAAETACGTEDLSCIYDFAATGSEQFASHSQRTSQQLKKELAQSKNTLPELEVPSNVSVTLGQPVTFQGKAKDPDAGDTVTYKAVSGADGKVIVNSTTGEVTANINDTQPVQIGLFVTDSSGGQSVVKTVPIVLCPGCNGHGVCDFTETRQSVGTFYFQHAVCVCQDGWTGEDCEQNKDACLDNPCDPLQNCTYLSPSLQAETGVGYECSDCPSGYSLATDGSGRCLDVDECTDGSDDCEGECENTAGGYLCSCRSGYRLASDGRSCLDVNECAEKLDNCHQLCVNTLGSFQCDCQEGFDYDSAQNVCTPTQATANACQNSGCSQGCTTVTDSSGLPAPRCFCPPGYDLDPADNVTCIDHDECGDGLCTQVCNNTEGSFSCSCFPGYQLSLDQRTCSVCPTLTYGPDCALNCSCSGRGLACHPVTGCVCQPGWTGSQCRDDVDECAENPDVCGKDRLCSNNEGSYSCVCRPGYELTVDGQCADIDECGTGGVCSDREQCTNLPGSYICTCLPGYQTLNGSCIDMDECSVNGGGCQQRCVNVEGSYNCDCFYGYTLNADRSTCTEVSEPCKRTDCEHGCTLDDNDAEICFCNSGFALRDDGHTCLDVDECGTAMVNCSHACNNTEGGFFCSCPEGTRLGNDRMTCEECPEGTYGSNCSQICDCGAGVERCDVIRGCVCKNGWTGDVCNDDVNECDTTAGREECAGRGAECRNLYGSYTCRCRTGFKMDENGICQDIDECAANSPCGQQCENTPGSYRCLCRQGFSFDSSTGECKDIDECLLTGTHSCTQQCQNVAGSYRCSCNVPGYVLDNDGRTCIAETTCTRSDCDSVNGGCAVDGGQEKCFCNTGYTLGSDGTTCSIQVTDWCAEGVCDQLCQLTQDGRSFTCACNGGFLLNDDKRTCRVCPQGTYGDNCASNCTCDIHHTASCDQVTGTCQCMTGWTGVSCSDDVNECKQTSPPACTSPKACQNTLGSYVCLCGSGYIQASDGSCKQCPAGTFGENCEQTCSCPAENAGSCDHVTGTCHCKDGWEGERCDLDIDECGKGTHDCSAVSHTVCQNTDGSFTCVCETGYSTNENGACVAATRFGFTVTVFVDFTGDLSPDSADFKQLKKQAADALLARLVSVRYLLGIAISSIRRGSLIMEAEAIVDNTIVDYRPQAASLTMALIDLNGQNLTIGNLSGPVAVTVGETSADSSTNACDIYANFVECGEEQTCTLTGGMPACHSGEQHTDSKEVLIIGLTVGVPVGIVIVCLLVAACWYCCSKKKRGKYAKPSDPSSATDPPYQSHIELERSKPPHNSYNNPSYGQAARGEDNFAFSFPK